MHLETIRCALENAKADPVLDRSVEKLTRTLEMLVRYLEEQEAGGSPARLPFTHSLEQRPEARL